MFSGKNRILPVRRDRVQALMKPTRNIQLEELRIAPI
jgi:hypothetical protein